MILVSTILGSNVNMPFSIVMPLTSIENASAQTDAEPENTDDGGDDDGGDDDGGDDDGDGEEPPDFPSNEICFDGEDNDGDGLTDSEDSDCEDEGEEADGEEPPDFPSNEICFDGEDNDGDGLTDSEDSDCESPEEDPAPPPPSNYLSYENPSYGLQINYPGSWRLEEVDSDASDNLNEIVQFYPLAGYANLVDVGIVNSAGFGITLDTYLQSITNSYRDVYGAISIDDSNMQAILGGNPAYQLIFSSNDGTIKAMETGTIIGDKVYYLRYITEPSRYSGYLPDVLNMIASLRLTE